MTSSVSAPASQRSASSDERVTGFSKAPPAERYEFFRVIQGYLEDAARLVSVPDHVKMILSQPKNELIVHFPVRMDGGEFRLFKGYRIQHSSLLGPFKGGMRYHESAGLDDF
jgi:glutamate dehydrogenase (NAD(P)+)